MSASSSVTSPHSAVSVPVSQTSTPSSPAGLSYFNSSAPSTPTSSPRVLTPDASTITGPRTTTLPTPDRHVSTREPLTPRKKSLILEITAQILCHNKINLNQYSMISLILTTAMKIFSTKRGYLN